MGNITQLSDMTDSQRKAFLTSFAVARACADYSAGGGTLGVVVVANVPWFCVPPPVGDALKAQAAGVGRGFTKKQDKVSVVQFAPNQAVRIAGLDWGGEGYQSRGDLVLASMSVWTEGLGHLDREQLGLAKVGSGKQPIAQIRNSIG